MNIEWESGETIKISPRDIPLNRAAFAVKEHFAKDHESFFNFMLRFFALLEVSRSETPKDWVRQNPDDPEAQDVHPAVIYAAAEVGLDSKGHFPHEAFRSRVAELAEEIDK